MGSVFQGERESVCVMGAGECVSAELTCPSCLYPGASSFPIPPPPWSLSPSSLPLALHPLIPPRAMLEQAPRGAQEAPNEPTCF